MAYSSRFETALSFATRLHADQVRKVSNVPYIGHLLGVASIAIEHGASEDEAIAALLHDAIEDQGGKATEEVICRMFGVAVATTVRGCTDADVIPKPPWRERKEAYIAHLAHASPSIRLVSAADKVHNARTILRDYRQLGEDVWQRFKGGRDGTLWYYRSLANIFKELGPAGLAKELDEVVTELEKVTAEATNLERSPG
jgi:(p)ppGpp synthase/HD superfamily hydrolase